MVQDADTRRAMAPGGIARAGLALLAAWLLAALPAAAHADAAEVLFVYGNALVEASDGQRAELARGSVVSAGDTVITGTNGRVQLRLADGGLLALRPRTEFRIEQYVYVEGQAADDLAASDKPRSFFLLLKGGFRSITGAIGKSDKDAYRVRTPVATIGIRGTDYRAVYCEADCAAYGEGLESGLYVGVLEGGVTLRNAAGALDLDPGDFGYVASADSPPRKSAAAGQAFAAAGGGAGGEEEEAEETREGAGDGAAQTGSDSRLAAGSETSPAVPQVATDSSGNPVDLTSGSDEALVDGSGAVAYAAGPFVGEAAFAATGAGGETGKAVDQDGNLLAFDAPSPLGDGRLERGTADVLNVGRDAERPGATGLHWGRWGGGRLNVVGAGGPTGVDLGAASLHWITGPDGTPPPQLPTAGTADFVLVGNTSPTDSRGNVGTLGTASLRADFTAQTVDADVSLGFDAVNEVWDASARDVDINRPRASFAGEFDAVRITDTSTGSTLNGAGTVSGFFTGDSGGALTGAGLGYSLTNGLDVSVSGVAAFQLDRTLQGRD